jgi:hypothetical protein
MKKANANLARKLVDRAMFKMKLKQIEKLNSPTKLKDRKPEDILTNPMNLLLNGLENSKPILKVNIIHKEIM